jgi:hypothetical protein
MLDATIHDYLYLLALVYTNDIHRIKILYESKLINFNFNFVYHLPLPNYYNNKVDVINDLLLIIVFFIDLNDFIKKNRLFQILFSYYNIKQLLPHPKIKSIIDDSSQFNENNNSNLSMQNNGETNEDLLLTDEKPNEFFEITLLKVAVLMEYEQIIDYLMDHLGCSIKPLVSDNLY